MKLHANHNGFTAARAVWQRPAGGRPRLHHILIAAEVITLCLAGRSSAQDKTAAEHPPHAYQHPGVSDLLPVFREGVTARLSFPYSWPEWSKRKGHDFDRWRAEARERVACRFLAAPPLVVHGLD